MYVYTCVHTRVCIRTYAHIYATHTNSCTYIQTHISTRIKSLVIVCVCGYMRTCTRMLVLVWVLSLSLSLSLSRVRAHSVSRARARIRALSVYFSLIFACSRSLFLSHVPFFPMCAWFASPPHSPAPYCNTLMSMGWLRLVGLIKWQVSFAKEPYKRDDIRLVGLIKWQVSFAKEPYKRDDILQKRPII